MTFRSYREESRKSWGRTEGEMTRDDLTFGAILRIADATEKMAQRHEELIRSRDFFQAECARLRKLLDVERRRAAALRGVLKKKSVSQPAAQAAA